MKTLVVASGKGGTGKTTLTAAFAHLASTVGSVIVADCDVEAANLPIALGASDVRTEPFGGGAQAFIDATTCTACGACVDTCRFGAIVPAMDGDDVVYRVDPWACEGCAACTHVCPADAVSMRQTQAGEVCEATTPLGPIVFGTLRPGEDLSGKLVTEVRDRAAGAAAASDALLLVDGPPGIGCPVIAAITNTDHLVAVTEPTASGVHDLDRLVRLARRLDVTVSAVLNKADLSEDGALRVRSYCADAGVDLIGEVPFDRALAALLGGMAQGAGLPMAGGVDDSPGLAAVRDVWKRASERLGE